MNSRSEHILVVDDEPAVRALAALILRRDGFPVVEAPDGLEALDRVTKGAVEFALVITDVVMPRLSGVQLYWALEEIAPTLPVVFMSGYSDEALQAQGNVVPCSFLSKPFTPEQLLAEVVRCLPQPA